MKKLVFAFLISFCFIPFVKADDTNYIFPIENTLSDKLTSDVFTYIYNTLIPTYPDKDYIIIQYPFSSTTLYVNFFNPTSSDYVSSYTNPNGGFSIYYHFSPSTTSSYTSCSVSTSSISSTCSDYSINDNSFTLQGARQLSVDSPYIYYYSLYDSSLTIDSPVNFEMSGFYSDNIRLVQNNPLPTLRDLYDYNSFSDYQQDHINGYTEVNLDNYDYVLLSLKNYNQNESFQSNFYVKGSIGITPIYNYGQSSKDSITGVQVQDRCNISYSDYTELPFYILDSDLQNNSIYAVKSCSSGSSFKFDNSIFDITFITQQNVDNPTITINGNTYDVIPYDDLPSTATKNEEDNYIPGESGSATDTSGIDSAIKNVQQSLSSIWNSITYFTSLVGLLFSSLPDELRVVLYSSFVITITIGIIKFFIK